MSAIAYPLDLHRKFEQRPPFTALVERRRSPPEGTDNCVCGDTVIAPSSSTYAAGVVVNHWQCTKCGRQWTTSAFEKT